LKRCARSNIHKTPINSTSTANKIYCPAPNASAVAAAQRTTQAVISRGVQISFIAAQKLFFVGTATAGRMSESALQCYDISAKLLRDNMLYALAVGGMPIPEEGEEPEEDMQMEMEQEGGEGADMDFMSAVESAMKKPQPK
jgi:hypothetical protein